MPWSKPPEYTCGKVGPVDVMALGGQCWGGEDQGGTRDGEDDLGHVGLLWVQASLFSDLRRSAQGGSLAPHKKPMIRGVINILQYVNYITFGMARRGYERRLMEVVM